MSLFTHASATSSKQVFHLSFTVDFTCKYVGNFYRSHVCCAVLYDTVLLGPWTFVRLNSVSLSLHTEPFPAGRLANDIERLSDVAAADFAIKQMKKILPNASEPVWIGHLELLIFTGPILIHIVEA